MRSALVVGDTHVPFVDYEAWRAVMAVAKALEPDVLIHMGDAIDNWQCSTFDKDPARKESLQDDIDETASLLRGVRKALPKADCYLLCGNHEDRLRRTIWRMSDGQRELAKLRVFQNAVTWPNLLDLKAIGFKFVDTQGQARTRILPKLITKHGSVVRRWSAQSAKAEWERYGKSGLSGHTHRLGSFYTNDFNGAHTWTETGCTCSLDPTYCVDPNWQQGCVIVTYVGDRFAVEPVYIQNGSAIWRGKEFHG